MRKLIDPAYKKHPGFYSRGKAICGHAVNLPFCALSDEKEEKKKAAISNQCRRLYRAEHARARAQSQSVSQSVSPPRFRYHFPIRLGGRGGKKVRVLLRLLRRRRQSRARCFEVLNVRVCPLRWPPPPPPLSAAFYRPCRTSDNKSI